jgi:hypothetical protein
MEEGRLGHYIVWNHLSTSFDSRQLLTLTRGTFATMGRGVNRRSSHRSTGTQESSSCLQRMINCHVCRLSHVALLFASGPLLQVKSLAVQRLHPIKRPFVAKSAASAGYEPATGFLLRAEDGGNGGSDYNTLTNTI